MSDKTYRLKIKNTACSETDTDWSCDGFVGESVIEKIRKQEFVEFNLLISYVKESENEETANYRRCYYSPVRNMDVQIEEISNEEQMEICYNRGLIEDFNA